LEKFEYGRMMKTDQIKMPKTGGKEKRKRNESDLTVFQPRFCMTEKGRGESKKKKSLSLTEKKGRTGASKKGGEPDGQNETAAV